MITLLTSRLIEALAVLLLTFSSESSVTVQQGKTVAVPIAIENATDVYAVDLTVALTDAGIAQVIGMTPDGVLPADFTVLDGTTGNLVWTRTGDVDGFSGNGHLVTVELLGVSAGTTQLTLSRARLCDSTAAYLDYELSDRAVEITVTPAPGLQRVVLIVKREPLASVLVLLIAIGLLLLLVVQIRLLKRILRPRP